MTQRTINLFAQRFLGDARKRKRALGVDIAVHLDNAVKADDDSTTLRLIDRNFELVTRNHHTSSFQGLQPASR